MEPDAQYPMSDGRVGGEPGTDKPALKVVIIFETVPARERARRKVERLLTGIASAPEVETAVWGFEEVGHPEMCEKARAQAEQADIILLSADGDSLPAPVLVWVERCLPGKSAQPAALVALFGENKPASGKLPRAGEYLRQMAQTAGVDFFCEAPPGRGQGLDRRLSLLDQPDGGPPISWVDKPEALACQGYGVKD